MLCSWRRAYTWTLSCARDPVTDLRTGGQWVVEALAAEGVRHVFGVPGVHNLAIYDALPTRPGIAHVLARHEQGAAFMADGYARASGEPGVVVVTTGPGATNALTPLVESYASSVPVLLLMSDIPAALIGKNLGALHEVPNQIDCFRPVSRWAETVRDGGGIAASVQEAFERFRSRRPGPIALSIPTDLLMAKGPGALHEPRGARARCDAVLIDRAAALLRGARRPLVLTGGGVVAAGAEAELIALARRLRTPVVTTVNGRGVVPETDALWLGVLPNRLASQTALESADVVLAVGCRFAHRSTKGLLLNLDFRPEQKLIHLDLDPEEIGRQFKAEVGIVGDARDGLAGLVAALGASAGAAANDWDWAALGRQRGARWKRWTETDARLIRILRDALPPDGIVVNDQTGLNYWMEWHYPVLAPRTFLYPIGSATLGYGVPAAIGAKIARPDRPVVAVMGDGGFLFSVNELATAVKYSLPIVFLVLNDNRYGAIKYLQEMMFAGRWSEADLANPDFPAMARSFGAEGHLIKQVDDLPRALDKALAHPGPSLLEVPIAIDPPWEL
jgi:thiamine pyrophosphate-dependent acetolactate synthase large subunit-like protein